MLMSVKDDLCFTLQLLFLQRQNVHEKSQQFSPAERNMKDCLAFEIMTLLLDLSAR